MAINMERERMESCLHVLYASQSGNAEELAFEFYDHLRSNGINSIIEDVQFVEPHRLLDLKLIVFIVSTTGYGDTPDSMKALWKFLLRKSLEHTTMSHCRFTVFGLGDSAYEHFNVVARKLTARLLQLGAQQFADIGFGDDQAPYTYYSAFNKWEPKVLDELKSICPIVTSSNNPTDNISISYGSFSDYLDSKYAICSLFSFSPIHRGVVLENHRITHDTWFQDIRRLSIEPHSPEFSFQSGDVVALYYDNSIDTVERALKLCCCQNDRNRIITVNCSRSDCSIRRSRVFRDCSITIENLFRYLLDINGVPKRSFFGVLSRYTANEELKRKLRELASFDGTDLYIDFCVRERRTFVDILEEFKIDNFPLQAWIEFIPIIQPRSYSIASSPSYNGLNFELCVAISERRTPYGRKKVGLCSNYISTLDKYSEIMFYTREGKIRGTKIESTMKGFTKLPIIGIATGTGIAPIRSIIQDVFSNGVFSHNVKLIHGCRQEGKDNLFSWEWYQMEQGISPYCSKSLSLGTFTYHPMYSQQFQIKRYVTHFVKENGPYLVEMLTNGATLMISGSSAQMPKHVLAAIVDAVAQIKNLESQKAKQFVDSLIRTKYIVVDAW